MAIYVGENKALILKSDRSIAKLFKGDNVIFGYDAIAEGEIVTIDNAHSVEHKLGVNVKSKNIFDADTVLPSLENPNLPYDVCKWKKQADGSFYMGNLGGLVNYKWFENTKGYNGQFSFSITTKANNGTDTHGTLQITFVYADGSKEYLGMRDMLDYTTYTFVTNANKTLSYIYQTYNSNASTYVKDIMIAYGTDTTYTPYMTDFSSVEVKQKGKNLIPFTYQEMTKSYDTYGWVVNDDGTIVANGYKNGTWSIYLGTGAAYEPPLKAGVTYKLSGIDSKYGNILLRATDTRDNSNKYFSSGSTSGFVWEEYYKFVNMYILFANGVVLDNLIIKPQLEIGTIPTEYEPPTHDDNIITATATVDGTVEGLTSLSPNITLFTDTGGAIINCKYVKG